MTSNPHVEFRTRIPEPGREPGTRTPNPTPQDPRPETHVHHLLRPQDHHHERPPSRREPRRGSRRLDPRRRDTRRAGGVGAARDRRPLRGQGHHARPGRRPLPQPRRQRMGRGLRRLPRPDGARPGGAQRARVHRRGRRSDAAGRTRAVRPRRTAARVGPRSAVLRRAPDERRRPRPRLDRASDLRHASERPHHQRQRRADAPRRDHPGYRGDGGDEGCERGAHRRAAGAGAALHRVSGARARPCGRLRPAACVVALRPLRPARRGDHGDGSRQRAARGDRGRPGRGHLRRELSAADRARLRRHVARTVGRCRVGQVADPAQQRAPEVWAGQAPPRRFDPGLHRALQVARVLQRSGERAVVHRPGCAAGRDRHLPRRRTSGAHPHQRGTRRRRRRSTPSSRC